MTTKNGLPSENNRLFHLFREYIPPALAGLPALMIPLLEWWPDLTTGRRTSLIIAIIVISLIGIVWNTTRVTLSRNITRENQVLRAKLNLCTPESYLRDLSHSLFKKGAWRLSVWEKQSEKQGLEQLALLAVDASDSSFSDSTPSTLKILRPALFSQCFTLNLAGDGAGFPYESGEYPEGQDVLTAEWEKWRSEIFGMQWDRPPDFARPRKFAWAAQQDSYSKMIIVVIAESAHPAGISLEPLQQKSTREVLGRISRIVHLDVGRRDVIDANEGA